MAFCHRAYPPERHRTQMTMKAAIYARVSTTDQNCEMQLRELREYCARHGWDVCREYVDTGWSGSKVRRPQLDRLMADARLRKMDCVVVWKLDRWARSNVHCQESIGELQALGIRWLATTQGLDTDQLNPMSRAMLGMMAVFAEFEREMIRERVKAGMNAARHRGRQLGRRKVVFDRHRAADLKSAGKSYRAIAADLGVSLGTVAAAFKNGSDLDPSKPLN
jgi:DNA invertase Pin-like site-specific DNA recombinase